MILEVLKSDSYVQYYTFVESLLFMVYKIDITMYAGTLGSHGQNVPAKHDVPVSCDVGNVVRVVSDDRGGWRFLDNPDVCGVPLGSDFHLYCVGAQWGCGVHLGLGTVHLGCGGAQ